MSIYTIGHSKHPIDIFLQLITEHKINVVADVRLLPQSRFNPQYNKNALAKTLADNSIEYIHFKELGGMRAPLPDSRNMGLTNEAFRGYADHMENAEFKSAANKIIEISAQKNIVTMCAEAKPSECHRSLLADYFLANGYRSLHIIPPGIIRPHEYTKFAVAGSHEVTYPLPLFS